MNRKSISAQMLLYFLMLMFLAATVGCSSSDKTTAAGGGTVTTYSISGTVTGDITEGVTITLSGAAAGTAQTDADGKYTFTGLTNGSYTVKPSYPDYVFDPNSTAVAVSGANMTADFDATFNDSPKYIISGTVTFGGTGVPGVLITLSDGADATTATNADGEYSFTNLPTDDYTVTPSFTGLVFAPVDYDLLLSADDTDNDFAATVVFAPENLAGTWNVQMLHAGADPDQWARANVTISAGGQLTFNSFLDSDDGTTPPAGPIVWTIDANTGVITETDDSVTTDSHYTMTFDKKLIAGTANGSSQLFVIQKVETPATAYSNSDVRGKSFVMQQLKAGSEGSTWQYQKGTIDSSGAVTVTYDLDAVDGAKTVPYTPGVTVSVNSSGIVTMTDSNMVNYQGFMSSDKKTIVGTYSQNDNDKKSLMIIQITGRVYTAGYLPAGTNYGHLLGVTDTVSDTRYDFWAHYTNNVGEDGAMSFFQWQTNGSGSTPDDDTGHIDATGAITIDGNTSFHGQASDNGTFMVGTQTGGSNPYYAHMLTITMKANPWVPEPK